MSGRVVFSSLVVVLLLFSSATASGDKDRDEAGEESDDSTSNEELMRLGSNWQTALTQVPRDAPRVPSAEDPPPVDPLPSPTSSTGPVEGTHQGVCETGSSIHALPSPGRTATSTSTGESLPVTGASTGVSGVGTGSASSGSNPVDGLCAAAGGSGRLADTVSSPDRSSDYGSPAIPLPSASSSVLPIPDRPAASSSSQSVSGNNMSNRPLVVQIGNSNQAGQQSLTATLTTPPRDESRSSTTPPRNESRSATTPPRNDTRTMDTPTRTSRPDRSRSPHRASSTTSIRRVARTSRQPDSLRNRQEEPRPLSADEVTALSSHSSTSTATLALPGIDSMSLIRTIRTEGHAHVRCLSRRELEPIYRRYVARFNDDIEILTDDFMRSMILSRLVDPAVANDLLVFGVECSMRSCEMKHQRNTH